MLMRVIEMGRHCITSIARTAENNTAKLPINAVVNVTEYDIITSHDRCNNFAGFGFTFCPFLFLY